jgi:short-subunit dehydrogenase
MTESKPLAVVTGASSGIGYELALEFAKAGFDLIINAENDAIHRAGDALRATGASVTVVQSDLTAPEGVAEVVAAARAAGPLTVLALNAGVGLSGAFVGGADLDEALDLIRLNVMAPVILARELAPDMVARGEGRLLFTSSIASLAPGPFHAVYHGSKAFIQSFSEALREELRGTGVTVTSLMPGATETQFFARADMLDTKVGQGKKDYAAKVAKQGVEATLKGDDHVVAGSFMNKVQAVVSKFLPDTAKAKQLRKSNEPLDQDDEVDALKMLAAQHEIAEELFARLEAAGAGEGRVIFDTLARKLDEHMKIEEEVFYPAAAAVAGKLVAHAEDEHAAARGVIAAADLATGEAFMDHVRDLKARVMDHVREEEDELFPLCRARMEREELLDLADEMRDLLVEMERAAAPTSARGPRPDATPPAAP